jgi:D-lyxose ketol-isomerase
MLYVQSGVLGFIWLDDCAESSTVQWAKIHSGGGFYIIPNVVHQLYAVEGDVVVIETSSQHFDNDSYRNTTNLMHNFNHKDDGK